MAKVVVRLPEPKEEYDVSNQKQINMLTFMIILLPLNSLLQNILLMHLILNLYPMDQLY